jgi:hypothetical protein
MYKTGCCLHAVPVTAVSTLLWTTDVQKVACSMYVRHHVPLVAPLVVTMQGFTGCMVVQAHEVSCHDIHWLHSLPDDTTCVQ